jgi:hypothetical protein
MSSVIFGPDSTPKELEIEQELLKLDMARKKRWDEVARRVQPTKYLIVAFLGNTGFAARSLDGQKVYFIDRMGNVKEEVPTFPETACAKWGYQWLETPQVMTADEVVRELL